MKQLIKSILLSLLILLSFTSLESENFKQQQLRNQRVKTAYAEKETIVKGLLSKKNINNDEMQMLIRVFKKEKLLEVWVKGKSASKYELLKEYPICNTSGIEGPKRSAGDGQTPEGFYYINRFNPISNFYLSLGINYPNASDKILSKNKNTGGDIFIHGNCVTIGCIPITDEMIKEVYLLAVEAKNNGEESIPVYIFPCKMTGNTYENLKKQRLNDKALISFWENIKTGYDKFESKKSALNVSVNKQGDYIFN